MNLMSIHDVNSIKEDVVNLYDKGFKRGNNMNNLPWEELP